ncbi:MAG: cytochrome c oxidase subunit II [Chloroflexi bacterium]|nr:cytochrome c oxidase subunit II [Chloroflexota bacterium]
MPRLSSGARRMVTALGVLASLSLLTVQPAFAEPWFMGTDSVEAGQLSQLWWLTLILSAVVFVMVEGLLIYSSIRFRRRTSLPSVEPPQIHGNTRLEVMWAIVPAVILISLFGLSVRTLSAMSVIPEDGERIRVEGAQFSWNFTYQDSGVQVSSTNGALVIPTERPVIFEITARDVIHSFWVPDLGGKTDAIPGKLNRMTWTVLKPGMYRGVCAELCGSGHAGMLFSVDARPLAEYQAWLEQQKSGAGAAPPAAGGVAAGDSSAGRALIASKGCGGCHNVPGVQGANGAVGPSLAGVAGRTKIAGGAVNNTGPDDLKKWIMDPKALKASTAMPTLGLTDAEATSIVAYLETLK